MNLIQTSQPHQIATTSISKGIQTLLTSSIAKNTLRAYTSDLGVFCHWLNGTVPVLNKQGRPIPMSLDEIAQTILSLRIDELKILSYLEHIGFRYKMTTIDRKLAALSWALPQICQISLSDMNALRKAKKGLRRLHTDYQAGLVTEDEIRDKGFEVEISSEHAELAPAKPMRREALKRVIAEIRLNGNSARNIRDAAILTLWWAGAFRRSEIASLRVKDVKLVEQGLSITLRKSKTDQEGKGKTKGIHYAANHPEICAVRHVKAWLKLLNKDKGFLFTRIHGRSNGIQPNERPLTDKAILNILKTRLRSAGFDDFKEYSGHSPRRGFVTDAYLSGAAEHSIQKQGGWASRAMVARYIAEDSVFEENATSKAL